MNRDNPMQTAIVMSTMLLCHCETPKFASNRRKMTSQENIPLPPSKGELSDIVPPLKGAGGCFFLFVISSLRSNPEKNDNLNCTPEGIKRTKIFKKIT